MSRTSTPRGVGSPSPSATGSPAPLGLMAGSPASSIKRAKGRLSRTASGSGEGAGDAAAAQLLEEPESETPVLSRTQFAALGADTRDETISEADSDEEEQLPLDEDEQADHVSDQLSVASRQSQAAHPPRPQSLKTSRTDSQRSQQDQQPGGQHAGPSGRKGVGEMDKLTLLLSDTPMSRLRAREKEARKAAEPWVRLRLRQDILGIAKLYSDTGPYRYENEFPMLVAEAHFNLAKAYGDVQCVQQASEHCKRALESMPPMTGETHPEVLAFERDVKMMQAEMLLVSSPPKPQAALQHILAAARTDEPEEIEDLSIKVLAAQCQTMIGSAKLQEAYATQNALEALKQRVEALTTKLGELERRHPDYERTRDRIRDTKNELQEEQVFLQSLIDEAREQLDKATDVLMGVIHDEETRIKAKLGTDEWKKHPLIQALWRQGCEIMFKLSLVEGLAGNITPQLIRLQEVLSAHAEHECVPDSLVARTYKERGAALAAKAANAEDEANRKGILEEALECYEQLLKLQERRYPEEPSKQAVMRAEALKLIGNVNVGLRLWSRAQQYFQEAMEIFASYLGGDSHLVQDLEHRLSEVQGYTDGTD